MAANKHLIAVLFLLLCNCLPTNSQTVYTDIYPHSKVTIAYETFDVQSIRNKYAGSILDYSYTKGDGTKGRITSYKRGTSIEVFETFPYPYTHILYKKFYANGRLQQKGVMVPLQFRIGKWLEFDQKGNHTLVDYEIGRSAFNINDILLYLEQNDYYNSELEGLGRWSYLFWYTPESKQWGVRLSKGNIHYKRLIFDGLSGNLLREENLYNKVATPPVYDSQSGIKED